MASNSYYDQNVNGNQGQKPYPMQPYGNQEGYAQNQNGYQQEPPQQQHYSQVPPNYTQDNGRNFGAQGNLDQKQTFDQAFKLSGPKYNDLWAGGLVKEPIHYPDGLDADLGTSCSSSLRSLVSLLCQVSHSMGILRTKASVVVEYTMAPKVSPSIRTLSSYSHLSS